ncbi:hypothetical protein HPB50_024815 [Hyalomma asiaticum]|uniref:Uncharacterized protein n=1 Tax=Hyalomma asiaticum TaxID=266040 RepID=A0ACB7TQF4_HYAAI|nr:hypothetical protein HPB50_024815 [Hyalomma asiaticum]
MKDTLSTAKTWAILRSLLDPGSTKTTVSGTIRKLVSDFTGTEEELLNILRKKYVGDAVDLPCTTEYEGLSNADLDAPITRAEPFAAAQTAKRNTAPGPDRVTNAMLRNLSDDCLDELIAHFNEHIWEPGILPPEWKAASIDVFLRLRDEVLRDVPSGAEHILVALDLRSAFDTMGHELILQELSATNCGERTYNYVRSFLTDRTATIGIGEIRCVAQIHIAPLPKNMSPVYHRARRDARARKLAKQYGTDPDTLYTDAARCGTHGFSLAAVGSVSRPGLFTCASARTNSANTAEALAVALAIKTKESLRQGSHILTDSQIACRYFTSGRIPACVAHLLGATLDQDHSIIWCPAHIEATGNDRADGAARALTYRATVPRLGTRLIPQLNRSTVPSSRIKSQESKYLEVVATLPPDTADAVNHVLASTQYENAYDDLMSTILQ